MEMNVNNFFPFNDPNHAGIPMIDAFHVMDMVRRQAEEEKQRALMEHGPAAANFVGGVVNRMCQVATQAYAHCVQMQRRAQAQAINAPFAIQQSNPSNDWQLNPVQQVPRPPSNDTVAVQMQRRALAQVINAPYAIQQQSNNSNDWQLNPAQQVPRPPSNDTVAYGMENQEQVPTGEAKPSAATVNPTPNQIELPLAEELRPELFKGFTHAEQAEVELHVGNELGNADTAPEEHVDIVGIDDEPLLAMRGVEVKEEFPQPPPGPIEPARSGAFISSLEYVNINQYDFEGLIRLTRKLRRAPVLKGEKGLLPGPPVPKDQEQTVYQARIEKVSGSLCHIVYKGGVKNFNKKDVYLFPRTFVQKFFKMEY